MRSILRSSLLASFALTMTWGLSGCEDTTKTTPPAAPTTNSGTVTGTSTSDADKGKMEPAAKDKMDPIPPPATPPVEPPK